MSGIGIWWRKTYDLGSEAVKGKCDQIGNFSRVRSAYRGWFSITHISNIFLYQGEQETLLDMSGAPWGLYQSQFYQRNRTSRRYIYSVHKGLHVTRLRLSLQLAG